MQCKDIPNETVLDAVDETEPMFGVISDTSAWRSSSDVLKTLSRKMGTDIPEQLFLAKANKLINRDVLQGCACGCRGDFHTGR